MTNSIKFQGKRVPLVSESTGKTFQVSLENGYIKIKAQSRDEESYKISDITSVDSGPTQYYGIRRSEDDWGEPVLKLDLKDDYRTFVTVDTKTSTFHVPENINVSKEASFSPDRSHGFDDYDFF